MLPQIQKDYNKQELAKIADNCVNELLDKLNLKEKEILILAAAGYDNHDIAMHLGYKNNKIVATRLGQIEQKVKTALNLSDLNPR
jgi:FixJ family two-component response regulator